MKKICGFLGEDFDESLINFKKASIAGKTPLVQASVQKSNQEKWRTEMTKRQIGVGVHYLAIPEHPYYQKEFGWNPANYPQAQKYGRETVSLPISPKLTEDDLSDVINAVKDIL